MLTYRVETERDDNGTVLLTVPAFPEVTTFADTPGEATKRVAAAVEEAIAARIAYGQDIPPPDSLKSYGPDEGWVSMASLVSLKALLYQLMREQGVTRAELQRRLGCHREQVDRLFKLDHASRMDQLEAAAEALGMHVSIGLVEAA
jgi:antitoxin HicB